jgi:hypothetical protein
MWSLQKDPIKIKAERLQINVACFFEVSNSLPNIFASLILINLAG